MSHYITHSYKAYFNTWRESCYNNYIWEVIKITVGCNTCVMRIRNTFFGMFTVRNQSKDFPGISYLEYARQLKGDTYRKVHNLLFFRNSIFVSLSNLEWLSLMVGLLSL